MARNEWRRATRPTTFARPLMHSQSAAGAAPLPVNPAFLVIPEGNISMNIGDTAQLSSRLFDQDGNLISGLQRVITWMSSLATVASTSTLGLVTGVGVGLTTVTATSSADSISGSVQVTVNSPQLSVASILISPSAIQGTSGTTGLATCTVYDTSNTPMTAQVVTWSGTSAAVFTVGSDDTASDPVHRVVLTYVSPSSSTVTLTATV